MKSNNKGFTALSMLVCIVIIGVFIVVYFAGIRNAAPKDGLDKGSEKQTTLGKTIDTAKSVDCLSRISQTRTAIAQYKMRPSQENSNPPDLKSLNMGVSDDYFTCPVSGKDFEYKNGSVSCPTHPDH